MSSAFDTDRTEHAHTLLNFGRAHQSRGRSCIRDTRAVLAAFHTAKQVQGAQGKCSVQVIVYLSSLSILLPDGR